ncbi:MAG: hypothetical protein K6F82_06015 [Sphaerochaetaceae bacterium]|nr:hypothetical protein [Sphaerochaetaceae bacterium]
MDYRNIKERHLLEAFKFRGIRSYASVFAFLTDRYLRKNGLQDSVIVPVPCSSSALKRRGWDHMEEVAKVLKRKYSYTVLNVIVNTDNSSGEQKEKNLEKRMENSENRFALKDFNYSIHDKRIIVLDDICTTGTTIKACMSVLEKGGFKNIIALTVFAEL